MKAFIVLLALCAVQFGGSVPLLDGRIVGGEEVDIADYPYQVSVRYYGQHICGGTIIDDTTIICAAHCVDGLDHSQYDIGVGNSDHNLGQFVRVNRICPHEGYNSNSMENDVTIIKLSSPLKFSSTIQSIALQDDREELAVGTNCYVSGWGAEHEGSLTTPNKLKAVDVKVLSNKDCNTKYGYEQILSSMMCAQANGKDSCQGDSGGPLVAKGKLVGIVSWGYGCARFQYPGVYAKVSYLRNWIDRNRKCT